MTIKKIFIVLRIAEPEGESHRYTKDIDMGGESKAHNPAGDLMRHFVYFYNLLKDYYGPGAFGNQLNLDEFKASLKKQTKKEKDNAKASA